MCCVLANDSGLINFWIVLIDFLMASNEVTEFAVAGYMHPGAPATFHLSISAKQEEEVAAAAAAAGSFSLFFQTGGFVLDSAAAETDRCRGFLLKLELC